jgi:hypothetical protein
MNDNGLLAQAKRYEEGFNNQHYAKLESIAKENGMPLTSDQLAIMALIVDKIDKNKFAYTEFNLDCFITKVYEVQCLMPSGTLRSRQVFAMIANSVLVI